MLDYGRKLQRLANEDDLVPGLGLPTLHGGEWEGDAKRRDVREVFRAYTEEAVAREASGGARARLERAARGAGARAPRPSSREAPRRRGASAGPALVASGPV
jgi:hypothetical protein